DPQAVTAILNTSTSNGSAFFATFSYDASGNMARRIVPGAGDWSLRSDNNDQIRQGQDSGNNTERYFYDHRRHRFLAVRTDAGGMRRWRFSLGDEFEAEGQMASNQVREDIHLTANGESIARLTNACDTSIVPPTCNGPSVSIAHHDRRGDLLAALS